MSASLQSQPMVSNAPKTTASARRSRLHHRWYVPYLFLLPGLLLYVVWTIYPLAYQFYISFFEWKIMPGQVSTFIGLTNYERAFADRVFWLSMTNTVTYALITVAGQLILGLCIAILVHRVVIGKKIFRAIYYLPVVSSWVVVSFLFQYLFSGSASGLVNFVLMSLGLIPEPISWMANSQTAWVAIYALGIWKGVGWAMVIFLAALQSIPTELYEAAAIDGAGEFRQFHHLTLPLIRRATVFVLVALMIGGFQVFLSVLLITGGGPLHRTEVALSYMFDRAFGRLDFGYGAALSYILAAIIVMVSFVQMKFLNRPSKDLEY
jgi:multiple sugar transport system permease protein